MIAKWFGELVLRRRQNAILIALLCAIFPITSWLSMIVVVVVTLAKNAGEGFLVLMWALLPVVVRSIVLHEWFVMAINVLGDGLLLWLLALLYQKTGRWEYIISIAVIIGMLAVLLLHAWVSDPLHWLLMQDTRTAQIEGIEQTQQLAIVGKHLIIGGSVFVLLLRVVVVLIMGVAVVTSIKQRRQGTGFRQIRLHYGSVFILLLFVLLALVGSEVFYSLLVIGTLPFFVAGLSLLYDFTIKRKPSPPLFFLFFILFFLVLLFLPYLLFFVLLCVVLIAVADSFVNFRRMKWF